MNVLSCVQCRATSSKSNALQLLVTLITLHYNKNLLLPRSQQTKSSDALQHKNKNKTKIQG